MSNAIATAPPADIAVRVRKLAKRFGSKTAVEDLSFDIATGAAFGLIGPNGAGKTTTFSMLAGYLRPTAGKIDVLGFAPTAVDQLRSRIGVLPQDALLPASDGVGEFLVHMARLQNLPKNEALAGARKALAEVGGQDWWKQRCGSLSHGMAKRVALAQALLGGPQLLLLDEPTAGLDPRVAYDLRRIIRERKGRSTIVISSHNLHELEELCDAAAILDRGRLVACASMSELTAANEEIRILVAAGTRRGTEPGRVPVRALRDLPGVKSAELDEERLEIVVYFERAQADAETVIGQVLRALLGNQVRISGVTKGRGLERRVMEV